MMKDAQKRGLFPKLNRRRFLKQTGQLVIGFSLLPLVSCSPSGGAGDQTDVEDTLPDSLVDDQLINSWIRVEEGGRVRVLTGKMELGQGIKTALMQIAAEELDVDMQRVSIILADTARTADERYTAGSASIENSGKAIRHAAAEARMQLLLLAEEHLGVPAKELQVSDGNIQPAGKGQSTPAVSYWQLLQGRQLEGKVSGNAPLKKPADYKLMGTPYPRTDLLAMATGGAVYVHDMRLPGMVHARILRPPSYKARLQSLPGDTETLPGVLRLVRNGDFVGVIADKEYEAIRALQHLKEKSRWHHEEPLPEQEKLFAEMLSQDIEGETIENSDSFEDGLESAAARLEATYTRPYQMHGSIGPSCAIAQWQNEQLTIWTHSQGVYPLKRSIANMLDIPEENIRAIGVPGSGCYGHNGADDVAADAALMARAYPGRPVRVQWMREDEHGFEPYGSAMLIRLRGGLDRQGHVTAWQTDVWSDTHSTRPGGKAGHLLAARYLAEPFELPGSGYSGGNYRNAKPLYNFPAIRVVSHAFEGPLRTSALRGLGAYGNIFALESFMDELALEAGQDPLAFRLRHHSNPRAKAVMEAAARLIGWDEPSRQQRHGIGIAYAQYKNAAAYCAIAAEVTYDAQTHELRLERLTGAIDAGQTINPDGLKNQTEGGMIQSASWTLMEQVAYDRQHVTSRSWNTYPIMRFSGIPKVEVEVIDRPGQPSLGAGEAAQGPTAAAIANAVYQATGIRVRDLPITAEKIRS